MRVIAGSARGRRLLAPANRAVRPTSDRVREALFSSLGEEVLRARVLDLFAGSGALGIEAASRGAAAVVFVERSPRAAELVRANLQRAGLVEAGEVVETSAEAFARQPRGGPFDVVLCDPPYDESLPRLYRLLAALHGARAVAPGARVVVERDRRDPDLDAQLPAFLALERRRAYGDTVLLHLRAGAEDVERTTTGRTPP